MCRTRTPEGQEVTMSDGMIEETLPCEADKEVPPCPQKAGAAFVW